MAMWPFHIPPNGVLTGGTTGDHLEDVGHVGLRRDVGRRAAVGRHRLHVRLASNGGTDPDTARRWAGPASAGRICEAGDRFDGDGSTPNGWQTRPRLGIVCGGGWWLGLNWGWQESEQRLPVCSPFRHMDAEPGGVGLAGWISGGVPGASSIKIRPPEAQRLGRGPAA